MSNCLMSKIAFGDIVRSVKSAHPINRFHANDLCNWFVPLVAIVTFDTACNPCAVRRHLWCNTVDSASVRYVLAQLSGGLSLLSGTC